MEILSDVFEQIVQMTFTASIVIGVVLLLRLLLKRAPKVFSYALWAVVLFRLLCPVSVTSELSVFGWLDDSILEQENARYTPVTIETVPGVQENIETEVSNPVIYDTTEVNIVPKKDVWQVSRAILTIVWLLVMSTLLIYSFVQLLVLKRWLKGAMPIQGNIYLADYITSPFVLGVIAPKIYLPSDLDKSEYEYIILHEKYHISRGDHIVKIIAYVALCIHWFNPLVWLSFVLMGRDMEMSCDEAVMKRMGTDIRAQYSESLLRFATGQRMVLGMPLAFGEGETKGRVKNVMRYKKPKFWISLIAVLLCLIAGVCLLTNPKKEMDNEVVEEMSESGMPGQEENQETEYVASESEEEVVSEPSTLAEPPEMLLQDALSSNLDFFSVTSGTYSWSYPINESEMTSVEACGAFPTVAVKGQEWIRLTDYNGIGYAPYVMRFEITPDRITVREYDSLELGDEEAKCLSEKVLDDVYLLELEPRRIYEVAVEWGEDKLESNGFYGTAYYAFATWDETMSLESDVTNQLTGMKLPAVTEPFTEEVNNLEGVELIFEKYKSCEGDMEIANFSGKDLKYGDWFDIQVQIEDTWYSLAYINDNIAFHAVAYSAPDGETQIKTVDWSYMYGELPVGEYRIVTDIIDYRAPGDFDKYYIATTFEIR